MKVILVFCLLGILSQSVHADTSFTTEVNQKALATAMAELDKFDLDHLNSLTPPALEQFRQGLEAPINALLTQQLLRKLSQQYPATNHQKAWVADLRKSQQRLVMTNPDHPRHKLIIVDVGQLALTVESLWKVTEQELQIEQSWQRGEWFWPDMFVQDKIHQRALVRWIGKASAAKAEQLSALYLQQVEQDDWPDNELLVSLALASKMPEIWAKVWDKPADQHSVQLLQALPTKLSKQQGLAQLELAMANDKTASQAVMTLAKHFSAEPGSEKIWQRTFSHPRHKWFAAAAVGQVPDSEVQRKLLNTLTQSQPKAAAFARDAINLGAQR